jgi:quinol-cytochrome oxidoreductase complex cytochrome b subunit
MRKRLTAWLAARYPVESIREFLRHQSGKLLPPHTSWWHTLGSLLLFLTLNQVVTGVLLMVYYRSTPETTYESIHFIMTKANFGWLIRGLHAWGANLMILLLVAHMLRTFVMGTYKKPRELTWVVGVLIFGTVLIFGFTGYLLPWNQVSYWATVVGTEIARVIPFVGGWITTLLRGGEAVGGETLGRFFVVHVAVLPWVLVGLVGLHVLLVRIHGLAPREPVGLEPPLTPRTGLRFFPDHVAKESVVFSIFFALLVAVVLLFPAELGEKANPLRTPDEVKPEWYFLPTYQLLKYLPKVLGIGVSVVPIVVLLLWPFLDRTPARDPRKRPWSMSIGIGALALALLFGVLGYLSEKTIILGGSRISFDIHGIPHRLASLPTEGPGSLIPPGVRPEITLRTGIEEGKKMLMASVTQSRKPVERVKIAFFVQRDSGLQEIGQDETLDDGSAAIRFPEEIPGGPGGELHIEAEIREPKSLAGVKGVATLPGGIPTPPAPWGPSSPRALAVIGVIFFSGVLTTAVFYRLTRARNAPPPR